MPIVYQATNTVNGKRYIGVTKRSLARRRNQHTAEAAHGPSNKPFQRAIRKHGPASFEWCVLRRYATYNAALRGEMAFIAMLKPEYNLTTGGQGAKGRRAPTNHVANFIEKWRQLGPAAVAKQVVCYNDGRIFASASDAARFYYLDPSSISEVARDSHRRRSVGGLVFRYGTDVPPDAATLAAKITAIAKRSQTEKIRGTAAYRNSRPVKCVDDGNAFDSVKAAADHYGISTLTVIRSAKRRNNHFAKRGPTPRTFLYMEEQNAASA